MPEQSQTHDEQEFASYYSRLQFQSLSTQRQFQWMINNIRQYGKIDLQTLAQLSEEVLYSKLQNWINWNHIRGITATTLSCLFNVCRAYMWHLGIKLHTMDIKGNLYFPRPVYTNQIPITPDKIQKLLSVSSLEFRFQLLALVSSGMRVGELGQIKLSYLDMSRSNILINLPGHITKTRRGRITFLSKQVSDMIRYRIKCEKIKNEQLVFCGERSSEQAQNLITKRFSASRERANMMDRHACYLQNRYQVHIHSIRAYFVTQANQIQFGLGHIFAGHSFYMKEYNLYTIEELWDYYQKLEPRLTFKKSTQTRRLQGKNRRGDTRLS